MMKYLLILAISLSLWAKDYKVAKILDGDTIVVLDGKKYKKVRLFGIDAPESAQNFGAFCTSKLSSKLAGTRVKLDIKAKDKYNRIVAIVKLKNKDINRYMVQIGCAWAYTYYTSMYKKYELDAKKHKRGLWIDKKAQNPYEFRKKYKNTRSEADEFKKLIIWMHAWDEL